MNAITMWIPKHLSVSLQNMEIFSNLTCYLTLLCLQFSLKNKEDFDSGDFGTGDCVKKIAKKNIFRSVPIENVNEN